MEIVKEIPKQLRNNGFGFVKLKPKTMTIRPKLMTTVMLSGGAMIIMIMRSFIMTAIRLPS